MRNCYDSAWRVDGVAWGTWWAPAPNQKSKFVLRFARSSSSRLPPEMESFIVAGLSGRGSRCRLCAGRPPSHHPPALDRRRPDARALFPETTSCGLVLLLSPLYYSTTDDKCANHAWHRLLHRLWCWHARKPRKHETRNQFNIEPTSTTLAEH